MRLVIEGTNLPGRACGSYRDIHVGLQLRREPVGARRGGRTEARWEVDVEVVERDGERDFRGPAVQGKRGERFVYLTWGEVRDGTFSMFRRAKLMLDDVPDPAARDRRRAGRPHRRVRHAALREAEGSGARVALTAASSNRRPAQAAVSSASFCLTCAMDGFVWAVPSPYTRVGTVWLPLFADITTSAAEGSCSMSTTS